MMPLKREYRAVIWDPITEEEKNTLTELDIHVLATYRRKFDSKFDSICDEVKAYNLDDAEAQLIEKYGSNKLLSIWNEEDANKPR